MRASPRASWACGCCARCCPTRSVRPIRCRRIGTGPRRAMSSFASRSAARSGPPPLRWCARPNRRGIPWLRLNDQSLVQLGHGKFQQHIQATVTSGYRHIKAVVFASDKEETNKILATLGLPVPRQELVQNEKQAVRAARHHRVSGRDQALQRQPRPRHFDPFDDGRRGGAGFCRWPANIRAR